MAVKRSRKILYLIFSVLISVALWVYVVYVENPMLEEPITIDNIKIEFTNEEVLRDNDLIVSGISAREVTVSFSGRLMDGPKISKMPVRAVVDLSDILRFSSPKGTHVLDCELIYDSDIEDLTVEYASVQTVEVTVEQLTQVNLQLKASFTGSIAENYMAGTLTPSRDSVTVAGTEAALARIASATATLTKEGLSKTVTEPVGVMLWDEYGNLIDPEEAGITFLNDTQTVFITQNVLMVKEVALVIDTVKTPSVNDSNIRIDIDPATIRLSGDPEDLEGLNTINLGTVDLKSFYTAYSGSFSIVIPNNTNNLSGSTAATVTITIMDPDIDIRRLSTVNLSYRNAGERDNVEILNESMDVVIRGVEESISLVMAENVRIVADLAGVAGSKGTFEVPARVYVDGFPEVDAVGEYKITVFIS